nr:hypothetical protein 4 [bacterium]
MKTIDFAEMKSRKNGELTPAYLAENLNSAAEDGKIKKLVYITVNDDGSISCGWSTMSNTETIGLIEIGKQNILVDFGDE